MKAKIGVVLLASALMALAAFRPTSVRANDNLYQYKFPCNPQDACYVTTLAHVGNAFDFDPLGSAGLGDIRVVSEGTFRGYVMASDVCTTSGLGMFAVIDDMHGRTLRYAHLSQFGSLQINQRVLQGDLVGIEGNTGFAEGCQPHLHLEGIATAPAIDGIALSSITAGPTLYQSTNSVVGAFNLPGAAIRQKYFDLGSVFTSWAAVGWTADWTGGQTDCGSVPFCRLFVHYAPNALTGHWGSVQVFRLHPGAAVLDDNAITVGRWAVNDAYRMNKWSFAGWLGSFYRGGLPLGEERGPGAVCGPGQCCRTSVGCVRYQRLHAGYIWEHATLGVQNAVSCPDVDPPYPFKDYVVTVVGDLLKVAQANGQNDAGLSPFDPWFYAQYDVNGDGFISTTADLLQTGLAVGRQCWAGGLMG